MKQTPPLRLDAVRVPPPTGLCPTELRVLREVSDHQADRQIVGSTLLDAPAVGRQAHIWTLSDGEHLLLLMQSQRFCHWQASQESVEQLRERALDWLTEPEVDASPSQQPRSFRR